MPAGDVATFHADGKWRNRVEGGDEPPGEYNVKATALAVGRHEAVRRKVEHVIQDAGETSTARKGTDRNRATAQMRDGLTVAPAQPCKTRRGGASSVCNCD